MQYYLHKGLETTSSPIIRRGKEEDRTPAGVLSHSEQGYRNWVRAGGTTGPCGKMALAEARKTWTLGVVRLEHRELIILK